MLQNLLYFYDKKTHVVFFVLHFEQLLYYPNECPGLCQHRPGHSLVKKMKVARNEKRKKQRRFSYHKNIANFEAFGGTKTLAKTSYFWGVDIATLEVNLCFL